MPRTRTFAELDALPAPQKAAALSIVLAERKASAIRQRRCRAKKAVMGRPDRAAIAAAVLAVVSERREFAQASQRILELTVARLEQLGYDRGQAQKALDVVNDTIPRLKPPTQPQALAA